MIRKVAAIFKPATGSDLATRMRSLLIEKLGDGLDVLSIGSDADAASWARERCARGTSLVIVLAGDGTFLSVAKAMLGCQTPVGLVPVGTSNDIARCLGVPVDPREAMDMALGEHLEWVSGGRIGERLFFENAGVWFETDVVPVRDGVRHRLLEVLSGDLPVAWSRSVEVDVRIEPPRVRERVKAFAITVNKTAGGLFLTIHHDLIQPQAAPHGGYSAVRYPFRRASVNAAEPLPVHADGVLGGTLPVEIESIPKVIRMAASRRPVSRAG